MGVAGIREAEDADGHKKYELWVADCTWAV